MSNVIAAGWLFTMKDGKGIRALCKGRILKQVAELKATPVTTYERKWQ